MCVYDAACDSEHGVIIIQQNETKQDVQANLGHRVKSSIDYDLENMVLMSVCFAGLEAYAARKDIFALGRWNAAFPISHDSAYCSSCPKSDEISECGGGIIDRSCPVVSTSWESSSSSKLSMS